MFRPTSRLLECRVTLFTRVNCSLCDNAKLVLQGIQPKRPFKYEEINVMEPGQERWKSVYEFDTPVIHVDNASSSSPTTTSSLKLMHRFKEEEVQSLMDKAEVQ